MPDSVGHAALRAAFGLVILTWTCAALHSCYHRIARVSHVGSPVNWPTHDSAPTDASCLLTALLPFVGATLSYGAVLLRTRLKWRACVAADRLGACELACSAAAPAT